MDPKTIEETTYLTLQQAQVTALSAEGYSNTEIAEELDITLDHVQAVLYQKIPRKYEEALEDIDRIEKTLTLLDDVFDLDQKFLEAESDVETEASV